MASYDVASDIRQALCEGNAGQSCAYYCSYYRGKSCYSSRFSGFLNDCTKTWAIIDGIGAAYIDRPSNCHECSTDPDATVGDSTDPSCFAPGTHQATAGGHNHIVGNATPIAPLIIPDTPLIHP